MEGDDGETLSSNANKPSPQGEVNEPKESNGEEEFINADQKCDSIYESEIPNKPSPELKRREEAIVVEDKLETEEAVAVTEDMHEAEAVVDGGERLVPEAEGLHLGTVAEEGTTTTLESEKEKEAPLPERSGGEEGDAEIGDEPVLVAADTPALNAELGRAVEEGTTATLESEKAELSERGGAEVVGFGIGDEPRMAGETPIPDAEMRMDTGGVSGVADHQLAGGDSVAATEEGATVVDEVDQQEVAVDGGDENVSGVDISQGGAQSAFAAEGDDKVVDEAFGDRSVTVDEEKSVIESNNFQLIAENSVNNEGENDEFVPLEYSLAVMDAEKTAVSGLKESVLMLDDRQIGGELQVVEDEDVENDIQTIETKVDMDTDVEVAKVTEGENDAGLEGMQFVGSEEPRVGIKEKEKDRSGAVEVDLEMEEAMGREPYKNFELCDMQIGGSESAIVARIEENKEKLAEEELSIAARTEKNKETLAEEGLPIADTKSEMQTETEIETVVGSESESVPKLEDFEDVPQDEEDDEMVLEDETALADTEMETETDAGESGKAADTGMETETDVGESGKAVGGKRKRAKISKVPGNSKVASRARKTTDEDVCFICFDGGDLVICDRRGCPKAYHPSCVNRDEAFFRAKGRWNCGWHLCSICEKNAYYMCYTCTFSLCKACIKDAVILCVRGNKGFCETCMRTVRLIENSDPNQNDAQIDFDDRSSWEFLFKDYYTDLKSKLSLSSVEIAEAKNPWKGADALASKEDLAEAVVGTKNDGDSGSENSAENPEASKPKRKKAKKRLRNLAKEKRSTDVAVSVGGEGISTPGYKEWASKELLELVMHMKNGDRSVLSQFDVQALLLEYIKRNKLRDPRRKSQIICDSRLENLFGKPRVGHFEMLKLLESHFFVKDDSQTDDVQGAVVDTEVNQLEANENAETPTKGMKDRKRKVRKRGDARGPQYNRYEYAAIDIHNINLIYMRRKLMEDLLEDVDEFQNKVVGTFVRIRISGNMQKQDLYRLVQVVGTSKAAEPYKVGKRTTDMMLEILNLNKTESVSIDTISNQDFTEEECKRLRQSIKCGLLNRMTVGDILDKAMEVQAARVNDWLESEILRLSHLRDRASDMGHRKELRECVEKLQILKTPEERLRRLEEVPQIHADPNMDPSHESEEDDSESDDNRQDVFMRTKSSGFSRRGRAPISPGSDFSSKDSWNGGNFSSKNWESEKNFPSKNISSVGEDAIQSDDMVKENLWNQGREKETKEADYSVKLCSSNKPENIGWNSHPVARPETPSAVLPVNSSVSVPAKEGLPAVGSVNPSPTLSAKEAETAVKVNETQKMWHYRDPSGKVQGPFSVAQLRKWSNTGYFPSDLRIWRTTEKQDQSILLTDALAGRFEKEIPSGDSTISALSTLQIANVLSVHSGTSLQLAREGQLREKLNMDQNHDGQTPQGHLGLLKSSMAASVEVPKVSTEKWTASDSSSLPSPTPKHNNGGTGELSLPIVAISYSAAALAEHRSLSSAPVAVQNSGVQLTRGPEIDSGNRGSGFAQIGHSEQNIMISGNPLQVSLSNATAEQQKRSHMAPTQNNVPHPIQSVSSQNPQTEAHGGVGPPTQKVETNPSLVPGQPQAYSQWGAITATVQNPAGSVSNSGASALPQPEFWRPPMQSNQPNMQSPTVPNHAWGTGLVENNPSAPALRPENSNTGWVQMQGTPNLGWVGPSPGPTNTNWGTAVQGPATGNANSGWVIPPVNVGSTIQGPMAGNVNPGWVAAPGNPGVQALAPGVTNSGWVAPAGNMGSAVQATVTGNGWTMPTGNPGAPVQGPPSGSTNQGWGTPAGNQGVWGSGQPHGGGNFSGQRDKGSQGGDSSFGGGRPWNRQSSFGSGGSGGSYRHINRRNVMCPYNMHGQCKKGASCDYRHA